MEESQIFLYIHLRTIDSPQIYETLKLNFEKLEGTIQDLSNKILIELEQRKEGNKLFKIEKIHSNPEAKISLPNTSFIISYFGKNSDVYCDLKVEIDLTKHVSPLSEEELKAINQEKIAPKPKTKKVPIETLFPTEDKRKHFITLTNYSYYESGKLWVKVLIPLKGIKTHPKSEIRCVFKKKSFELRVYGFGGKNYRFGVMHLQCAINANKSTYVLKTNEFGISLYKDKESDNWWSLFKKKAVMEHSSEDEGDEHINII